jgi:predicted metalloprotease with PDZ domain
MQISDSTYGGYSGLEHSASHVDIVGPGFVGSNTQPSLYAHEIFHAWNVKRLRPADLVPYRYDREQPTTWLWVSEGITDYYADLALARAGIVDQAEFLALTAGKMAEIALTVPFSVEDASLNTWIHPTDGTGYSYYPKGSLIGFMLDIAIRDASGNKNSLDTVMRELYESTYKKGRGFTHDDFWGAVKRASNGKDYTEFERMYVDGREPLPWVSTLATAGLRLVPDSTPRVGVSTTLDPGGEVRVMEMVPGGAAARAGVLVGDALVKIGDVDVKDGDFGAKLRMQYAGRPAGTPLPIIVKRGAQTLTLPGVLAYIAGTPRLVEHEDASPAAVRIRTGILRGITQK